MNKQTILISILLAGSTLIHTRTNDLAKMNNRELSEVMYDQLSPDQQTQLINIALTSGLQSQLMGARDALTKRFGPLNWRELENIQVNQGSKGIQAVWPTITGVTKKTDEQPKTQLTKKESPASQAPSKEKIISEELPDYSFPREEYEHYMRLFKEIDSNIHAQLQQCEKDLGEPCIAKAVDIEDQIEPGTNETKGYPIIVIRSLKDWGEKAQKEYLKTFVDEYKNLTTPITQKERDAVLDLIKTVAPELYDILIKKDPTGKNHIERDTYGGFSSLASFDDGLPTIAVDAVVLGKYPRKYNEASIAHELGHYVSGHFFQINQPTHSHSITNSSEQKLKTGKKFGGKLPPAETFDLAKQRIKEHEADRSEILDFDIDIDTAIASAKALQADAQEPPHKGPAKGTFKKTHPFWDDRIKHFESLRSEAELKKAHGKGKTVFNWQKLANEYVKLYKQKYPD